MKEITLIFLTHDNVFSNRNTNEDCERRNELTILPENQHLTSKIKFIITYAINLDKRNYYYAHLEMEKYNFLYYTIVLYIVLYTVLYKMISSAICRNVDFSKRVFLNNLYNV